MQGRLSPMEDGRFQSFPRASWAEEFPRAAEAGLAGIEWIYDVYSEGANPIESDEGIAHLKELSESHAVAVRSLCADWFMEKLLFRIEPGEKQENRERLLWLLEQCQKAGIKQIVLPFVDSSSMRDESERAEVADYLRDIAADAQRCEVEIHLETDLGPNEFAALLESVSHPFVKANYDTGNSAALGYLLKDEFAAYGERIGSIHLKDRVRGGGTVPLGEGNVDWEGAFAAFASYQGLFIMQVARGQAGDEVEWSRRNREWIENAAQRYGFTAR